MKTKVKEIKAGTVIEAGTKGNRVSGVVVKVIEGEGKGTKQGTNLYKCKFNSAVRVRNVGEVAEIEPLTKAKVVHILYKQQFDILDF